MPHVNLYARVHQRTYHFLSMPHLKQLNQLLFNEEKENNDMKSAWQNCTERDETARKSQCAASSDRPEIHVGHNVTTGDVCC